MADEQEAIANEGQAEPATAVEQEATEHPDLPESLPSPGDEPANEGGAEGEEGDPAAEEPEAIEYVTLERNGKQYQVPKELEGEFLMHADYTKKTQSVAERAKELDAREQAITQQSEASEAELKDRATLIGLEERLAEFAKLTQADWDYHANNDPLGTEKAWRTYQMLKEQKADVAKRLDDARTERTQKAQQDYAKRLEDTREFAKKIPGWSPEVDAKMQAFAAEQGIPPAFIAANMSPLLYGILHKAWIGDQAMKKTATTKPAPAAAQPLRTVAGKSNPAASKSLADVAKGDDMEEYARLRAAGRAR